MDSKGNKFSNSDKNRQQIIQNELHWHETRATHRYKIDNILYAPPSFESIIQSAVNFLNPRSGDTLLEVGCGEGKEIVRLAQIGARVIGLDLSFMQLLRAKKMVDQMYLNDMVYFVQANAERLPFSTNSFQLIYGKAIIHHLDIDDSLNEIDRITKEGGRIALAEPLKLHPVFYFLRKVSPLLRTKYEHPLTYSQLVNIGSYFHDFKLATIHFKKKD